MTERLPGEPLLPEYFKIYREEYAAYAKAQFEYGKWLLTTFVALHAGALFVVGSSDAARKLISGALLCALVAGISLGLLSGLLTWANWSLHQTRNLVLALDQLTEKPSKDFLYLMSWINCSFWAAIVCGVVSGTMIPVAALVVWSTMSVRSSSPSGWELLLSFRHIS